MTVLRNCPECGVELRAGAPEGLCPRCLIATALGEVGGGSGQFNPSPDLSEPASLGDYELLECLGSGGMGVVHKARHRRLGRLVAIKTLAFGAFTRGGHLKRFQTEAEAAARLRHPHIVAIHELGEHAGQPWFAMEYVDGQNLSEVAREQPLPVARAVRLVRTIAEAVHYAHTQGIIHRDLKPSNILIDTLDQPHVADFGLAKDLRSDSELTLSGQTLGSPNYMPPEQAGSGARTASSARTAGKSTALRSEVSRGATTEPEPAASSVEAAPARSWSAPIANPPVRAEEAVRAPTENSIGPASDVYGLGAILYHLLTGRPPFLGESVAEVVAQLRERDPLSPRLLIPSLPRDLETICLKCLEKDPERRYHTALELAAELGRWQAGEPIRARATTGPERAWRWCRRKPALALTLASVAVLLLILGVGGPLTAVRMNRLREAEASQRQTAQAAATRAEHEAARASATATHLELQRIEYLFSSEETSLALTTLARLVREQPDNRVAVERLLSALTWRSYALVRQAFPAANDPVAGAMSQDGRRIAVANGSGSLLIFDLATGQLEKETPKGSSNWQGLEFSPDGNFLVARSVVGVAQVLAVPSLDPVGAPMQHGQSVNMARFSFDGRRVITASDDKSARVWDAKTGEPLTPPMLHDQRVISACFSPDGRRVLTAADDVFATVWDAESGQQLLRQWSTWPLRFAEFLPDGESFVAGAAHGGLHRWSAHTGDLLAQSQQASNPTSIAFNRDGTRCAVSAQGGSVRLLNSKNLDLINDSFEHDGPALAVAFSDNDLQLCSGGGDNSLRLWNLVTGKGGAMPARELNGVVSLCFVPDARRALTFARWSCPTLRDTDEGRAHPLMLERHHFLTAGSISPVGDQVILGWTDGVLDLRDATRGDHLGPLPRFPVAVRAVEFSGDGRRILARDESGTVRVLETGSGALLAEIRGHSREVTAAHLSWDGQRVLTASLDGTAVVWSLPGGQRIATLRHPGEVRKAVFSPDPHGSRVATTCSDFNSRVWNVDSGEPAGLAFNNGEDQDLQFSPDGNYLLAAGVGNFARVSDWRTGRETIPLLRHQNWVVSARFSPDGQRIVTASADRTVRVWDARTGQALIAPIRHAEAVTFADFDATGERLVSACADGTARIWDSSTGLARSEPMRSNGRLLLAKFDAQGQRVLTIPAGSVARVWETPPVPGRAPHWLPDLAEAMTAQRQLTNGTIETLASGPLTLAIETTLRGAGDPDFFSAWGRWFFANRRSRPVSPWGSVSVSAWVRQAIEADTLETLREAAGMEPDDPHVLARLSLLALNQSATENPRHMEEADWLSRRALALAPNDSLTVMARAAWLCRKDLSAAIALAERLPETARTHGIYWDFLGHMYRWAGRYDESLSALGRAVDSLPTSVPTLRNYRVQWPLLERSQVLRQLGRLEEATQDFHAAMGIPPRDSQASPFQVNLDQYFNESLDENHDDPGNTWASVPHGQQTFNGVSFDVRAMVKADGWRDANEPVAKILGIPVGFACRRLHFLHFGGTGLPDGLPMGKYVMHFANGETRELPLILEQNIGATWVPTWRPQTLNPECRVAWQGSNPSSKAHDHAIWLYCTTWENPMPEIPIESIDLLTFPPRTFVNLIAITGEQ
ncbi:MAG TPA: protein kinase [Verrucomicrobiota bacterium]|nr:hypothetical protein [Verrucomicrobiales bacterium]HRI16351.1 protein kinase [Verrucomicrobiota bacterium]